MIALSPKDEDSWGEDLYGIKVPLPERSIEVNPEDIELVLVPLVGFDDNNNRMGMGAGVYDRFLPKAKNAYFMGIAYSEQKVKAIPTEDTDRQLDTVVYA